MKQYISTGIILGRIEYGEADRIITLLTPDQGKLRLLAKGVRRIKSKLAGGIELFSVSQITYIKGRGDIGTLISARLIRHYGSIATNIDRMMVGYNLIKQVNRNTEDQPEAEYFNLLDKAFAGLNDLEIDPQVIAFWMSVQLLKLSGHSPNLHTDPNGEKLKPTEHFSFNYDQTAFQSNKDGQYSAKEIKYLRLAFSCEQPTMLAQVQNSLKLIQLCSPLVSTMIRENLRL